MKRGKRLTMAQRSLVTSRRSQQLVKRHVSALCRQFPHADGEELSAAGQEALMRAALCFDPNYGTEFTKYASWWVRGHLMRVLKYEERHRHPSLAWHRENLHAKRSEQQTLVQEDADAYFNDLILKALHGRMPASPEIAAIHRQTLRTLARARASLPLDLQALLHDHYEREITLAAYAAKTGMSLATIKRRHREAVSRLSLAFVQQSIRCRSRPPPPRQHGASYLIATSS